MNFFSILLVRNQNVNAKKCILKALSHISWVLQHSRTNYIVDSYSNQGQILMSEDNY